MSQIIVPEAARAEMKRLHAGGMSVVKIVKALGYSDYTVRCVLNPEFKEKRRIQVETARKHRTPVKHVMVPAVKPVSERGPIALTERYAIKPYVMRVPNRLAIGTIFQSEATAYHSVSLAFVSIQGSAA